MSSPDIRMTQDYVRHVDSAIEAAADDVDRLTKRRFWNKIETVRRDWPNFQRAYPWRIWMDAKELADVTTYPPVVISGGVVIPSTAIFWGPWSEDAPPYTWMELDRSQSYAFGTGPTPQRDVSVLANFGYWTQTEPGGTLGANANASATALTISDSSLYGVGDVIICGSESMLVRDNAMADTGQAQQGGGCSTASPADNQLTVADGTKLHAGEMLQLDAEWMLCQSVTGNVATVIRAFNGTQIDTHAASEVYSLRSLTVARGFGGTTAASHTSGDAISIQLVPSQVRELAIAESLNYVYQKTSGYARTIGENTRVVPGGSLPDLRDRVQELYGRKARTRVI
jgi:hypothetical protein